MIVPERAYEILHPYHAQLIEPFITAFERWPRIAEALGEVPNPQTFARIMHNVVTQRISKNLPDTPRIDKYYAPIFQIHPLIALKVNKFSKALNPKENLTARQTFMTEFGVLPELPQSNLLYIGYVVNPTISEIAVHIAYRLGSKTIWSYPLETNTEVTMESLITSTTTIPESPVITLKPDAIERLKMGNKHA